MVLGLKTKKGASIKVDYLINLQGIRPWPPMESLKSVGSLLFYWENGERSSGHFTCDAVGGVAESKEIYKLPVTLKKDSSKKGASSERYLKNVIEFHIYEDRKDKGAKGQHIGSAALNIGEYGIIKTATCFSCPISLKKNSKDALPSVLYVVVKPFEGGDALPEGDPSPNRAESIPDAVIEGNDGESEFASFTDDDVDDDLSSRSSRDCHSVASEHAKIPSAQSFKSTAGTTNLMEAFSSEVISSNVDQTLSLDQYGDFPRASHTMKENGDHSGEKMAKLSSSSVSYEPIYSNHQENFQDERTITNGNGRLRTYTSSLNLPSTGLQGGTRRDKMKHLKSVQIHYDSIEDDRSFGDTIFPEKAKKIDPQAEAKLNSLPARREKNYSIEDDRSYGDATFPDNTKKIEARKNFLPARKEKNDSAEDDRSFGDTIFPEKTKKIDPPLGAKKNLLLHESEKLDSLPNATVSNEQHKIMDKKSHLGDVTPQNIHLETSSEIAKWKEKVILLEEELMETAAIEVGIYSVVAEHGSSTNKVLASARRLSRFYLHASKSKSLTKRTGAAKAIISGLFSVSKACANDVPRLTFWLSNAIVLRATVSLSLGISAQKTVDKLKRSNINGTDWGKEEHQTFLSALENFESWIFSRIVESIWWQTLTPHMQCTAVSGFSSKKSNRRLIQEGEKMAIDLWKKAFRDACERLCPVHAGGHECGCLALIPRLVMEQLVVRLDVAMFNAILRESVEDMPTDPISDPISDLRVLPIPAGKLSFGAGVNLKNAVGSWSRWLTDLFGIEGNEVEEQVDTSFKSFHLLNALSDLMMLPFELLVDKTARKEICPTFGSALIKRVLSHFSSDEFNPNPMSDVVIDALDSEEVEDNEEEIGTVFPYSAAPILYSPPSVDSLARLIGGFGIQISSSVVQKCYTSDDELDELDSPMSPLMVDKSRSSDTLVGKWGRRTNRYQLLREAWKGEE